VDGVAWHGYVGNADAMTRVHNAFPEKNAYWTEGGPDYTQARLCNRLGQMAHTFTEILRNQARCIVGWTLYWMKKDTDHRNVFLRWNGNGRFQDPRSHTQRTINWAFAHFSKVIQRDAQVIGSHETSLISITWPSKIERQPRSCSHQSWGMNNRCAARSAHNHWT